MNSRFRKRSRFFSGLISFLLVFSMVSSAFIVKGKSSDNKITIFHTNDIHGNVGSAFKNGNLTRIGLDYLAALKAQTKNSILVNAGDATQGSFLASYGKGNNIVDLMSQAGYDADTIGNHAFDFGQDYTVEYAKRASFPYICANLFGDENSDKVWDTDEKYLLATEKYQTDKGNGANFIKTIVVDENTTKKIGFFGLTTPDTVNMMNPKNLAGVWVEDPIESAKKQVAYLNEEGVDYIVAITHLGLNESSSSSINLAKELQIYAQTNNYHGIDIILDGHSHTAANMYVDKGGNVQSRKDGNAALTSSSMNQGNGTVIQQTFKELAYVGKIEIDVDANTISYNLLSPANVQAAVNTPDQTVQDLYNQFNALAAEDGKTIVGTSKTGLYSVTNEGVDNGTYGQRLVRWTECSLGNLIADSMRNNAVEQLKSLSGGIYSQYRVVAMQNGAAIRTNLPPGDITRANVNSINIYAGNVIGKWASPKQIYAILENSISKVGNPNAPGNTTGINTDNGRFMQVSGLKFEYDATKSAGSRIQNIYLWEGDTLGNGKYSDIALPKEDDNKTIIIAINDYEALGGDEYTMFPKMNDAFVGDTLNESTEAYLKKITLDGNGAFNYVMPTE